MVAGPSSGAEPSPLRACTPTVAARRRGLSAGAPSRFAPRGGVVRRGFAPRLCLGVRAPLPTPADEPPPRVPAAAHSAAAHSGRANLCRLRFSRSRHKLEHCVKTAILERAKTRVAALLPKAARYDGRHLAGRSVHSYRRSHPRPKRGHYVWQNARAGGLKVHKITAEPSARPPLLRTPLDSGFISVIVTLKVCLRSF